MLPTCSEEEFIKLWKANPSASKMAKLLQVNTRNVYYRRRFLEKKHKIELKASPLPLALAEQMHVLVPGNKVRTEVDLADGTIIVASDCHYWPGVISTAHRAAVLLVKELKPKMYCLNGDGFDGAAAGRHGRIMWEAKPNVKQELEAVQARTEEIENAIGSGYLHWNWGNHDQRFNTKLAAQVPEFEGVPGFNLTDHFQRWKFSMSLMINGHTMIKHRWHNGIHAAYNNVLKSGVSVVTGHLHALQVRPYTDYNGTRYAVDTGTLADPFGAQFTYAEDSPANHRSGLAVLTFRDGKLLPPELAEVVNEEEGTVFFRGELFNV